jgi:hypothetical protein
VFENIKFFDESLPVCEDYDLWIRISREYEIGLINKELITKFAGHEEQLSFKYWGMDRFRIQSLLKYKNDTKFYKEIKTIIQEKCNILINGAKKRKNEKIILYYTNIINNL